ncbi:hypothetical protein BHE74_00051008 [Ensete ventricosum]|nr:hypothetical protein BHE74_00051008 [Ensete ventricosum]
MKDTRLHFTSCCFLEWLLPRSSPRRQAAVPQPHHASVERRHVLVTVPSHVIPPLPRCQPIPQRRRPAADAGNAVFFAVLTFVIVVLLHHAVAVAGGAVVVSRERCLGRVGFLDAASGRLRDRSEFFPIGRRRGLQLGPLCREGGNVKRRRRWGGVGSGDGPDAPDAESRGEDCGPRPDRAGGVAGEGVESQRHRLERHLEQVHFGTNTKGGRECKETKSGPFNLTDVMRRCWEQMPSTRPRLPHSTRGNLVGSKCGCTAPPRVFRSILPAVEQPIRAPSPLVCP